MLLGIIIFLLGTFESTEVKLLLTITSIGGCSLTGLCCTTICTNKKYRIFGFVGIGISVLCFLMSLFNIWGNLHNIENSWKEFLSLIVLAITFAHISLLLNIKIANRLVQNVLLATIIFIGIVAVMFLTIIFTKFENDNFFYRLLGAFSILDVVGTIVTPILNKTQKQNVAE